MTTRVWQALAAARAVVRPYYYLPYITPRTFILLFCGYFSPRKPFTAIITGSVSYAVDRFVGAIDRSFSGFALLNRSRRNFFKVRRVRMPVLLRNKYTPSREGYPDQKYHYIVAYRITFRFLRAPLLYYPMDLAETRNTI